MEITASILDYLGKYEGGILVSVSLMYKENCYDAIFYYTGDKMIITLNDKLHELIGDIELTEYYLPLMKSIITMAEPYEDIIDTLKEYEFDWNQSESQEFN